MTAILATAAALSVLVIGWLFAGYGAALRLVAARAVRRRHAFPPCGEHVTVVLAVHNEAAGLKERLRNLLDTDLAPERLSVVVASDASTDGSDDVALTWPDPRVRLVRSEPRGGKSMAQNAAFRTIEGGIVVITDCGTTFDRRTIPELVAPFGDAGVGAVDGALRFSPPPGERGIRAHGAYWDYESRVRTAESGLGILATASGAVMAARRTVIREIPGHVGDDCVVPLMAVASGLRVHRANAACAWDESNSDPRAEFRARIRMVVRNWQGTWMFPGLLAPWRRPAVALGLWSHKVLRWCAPVFVLSLLGSLAALGGREGGAWAWVAGAAWVLALLGGADAFATWWTRGRHRATALGSFALVCAAFGVGLAKAVSGHRIGGYRDRTAAAARTLLAAAVLFGAGSGAARAGGLSLPPGWEPYASVRATRPDAAVSPCVVAVSPDRRVAYCAAAGGESFAGGGAWAFGIADGTPTAPGIDAGRNCCALRCIGTDGATVLAAWRGSRELASIDAQAWRIRDIQKLDFVPMDVAVEGDRAWVVGFTPRGEGAVAAFVIDRGMLRPELRCRLTEAAHRAAIVGNALAVTEPAGGFVEWLDPVTLVRRARFTVGHSPVAIAASGGVALVATREGELLEVDAERGLQRRTDLGELFQLDPTGRALRDLDPTDVIALPGSRVIVGTYRVDGFLVEVAASGVRAVTRVPAAVRHALVSAEPDAVTLLLGRRSGVQTVSVALSGAPAAKPRFVARSEAVTGWAQMPAARAVAVTTSTGGSVALLDAMPAARRSHPLPAGCGVPDCLAVGPDGRLLAVAAARSGGHEVYSLPQDAAHPASALAGARSPSWIGSSGGQELVLDRLQASAWLRAGGAVVQLSAPRTRPRAAVRLADGGWVVIHDTQPDLGCSRVADGAWKDFVPLKEGGWPTAIAAAPGARSAYFVTFNGMLCEVGPDLRVMRHRDLRLAGASSIAVDPSGRIGVASENGGSALLLDAFGAAPVEFRGDGVQALLPQSDGSVVLVTSVGAEFARRAAPAPTP